MHIRYIIYDPDQKFLNAYCEYLICGFVHASENTINLLTLRLITFPNRLILFKLDQSSKFQEIIVVAFKFKSTINEMDKRRDILRFAAFTGSCFVLLAVFFVFCS